MPEKGKCCYCCCPRTYGVMIIPPYMICAVFLTGFEMSTYGMVSVPWIAPITTGLALMGIIAAAVSFIPQCKTSCGRTLVFIWWFAHVTLIWNILWWFLLFNDFEGLSLPQWYCDAQ